MPRSRDQRACSSVLTWKSWHGLWSLLLLVSLYAALVIPAMFFSDANTGAYHDAVQNHIHQVNFLIQNPFALLDFSSGRTGMPPGHHAALAWSAILLGYEQIDQTTWPILFVNAAFGFGFISVSWFIMFRLSSNAFVAGALTLPLVCSSYVINRAIWINTDNGGLLFYALTLFTLLFCSNRVLLAGLWSGLMVFWRQIYLPVVGAYVIALLFTAVDRRKIAAAIAAIVVSGLVVGIYVVTWGGMTTQETGADKLRGVMLNPAVPVHAIALFGLFSLAYSPLVKSVIQELGAATMRRAVLLSIVLGLLVWSAADTTFNIEEERWGNLLFLFARYTPSVGEHSLVFLPTLIAGFLAMQVMLLRAIRLRYYPAELVVLLLYLIATFAIRQPFQRYIEPHIILTFGVFASRFVRVPTPGLIGPVLMSAVFGLAALGRLYGFVPKLFK